MGGASIMPGRFKNVIGIEELIERWGFQEEMLGYFQQKGLNIVEIKEKGMHKPVRAVSLSSLSKFLYSHYEMHLLDKVEITLEEILRGDGAEQKKGVPAEWTIKQTAQFLRVSEEDVERWVKEGKLEVRDGKIPIDSIANFTGITVQEIQKSWPQLFLREELESMGISTNHRGYDWRVREESFYTLPPQVLVRNPGEIYFRADSPVRYSRLYVVDYVMNQLGARRWIPFLKMYYPRMKQYFPRAGGEVKEKPKIARIKPEKEKVEVSKKVRGDFSKALVTVEDFLIQQMAEAARKLDTDRVMRIVTLIKEIRELFPREPEKSAVREAIKGTAVRPAAKKPPKPVRRQRREYYKGEGLSPSEWIIRNQGIVRRLKHPDGKVYEQRISFEDFARIVNAIKPMAPPNNKPFRTSDWLKAVGWDKKQRYKLNVAAVVLKDKNALKISGKIRSATYELSATAEELDQIVQEITSEAASPA